MITVEQATHALDSGVVVGTDGELGKVGQIFVDDETGAPNWVTVKTGLFGTKESFVPLDDASADGGQFRVPYDKGTVKGAPKFDADQHLSAAEEDELYRYYRVGAPTATAAADVPVTTAVRTEDDTATLTRSEEQLHVGTQRVEAGRARLRKFVITEQQTVNVPVSREEVRVVREPLQPGDVVDGSIGEDVIEVTLTEERPVVRKDTVAVERIRLEKDAVTEQQSVTEQVRKEQIEFDTTEGVNTITAPNVSR